MQKPSQQIICKDIHRNEYTVPVDQLTFRPSVYALIVRDGKLLLSKEWDGYDFPGGGMELGETMAETLVREVKEETGLDAKAGKIIAGETSFFKMPSTGKFVQSLLLYFTAEILRGEISTEFLDENEKGYAQKAEWIPLQNIDSIKFINSVDSKEIIARATKIG